MLKEEYMNIYNSLEDVEIKYFDEKNIKKLNWEWYLLYQ